MSLQIYSLLLFLNAYKCQLTNQWKKEVGPNNEDIWKSTSDFIPVQSASFGSIKLGEIMSMEFDFIWGGRTDDPTLDKYEMFFRVGFDAVFGTGCNGQGARYPSLWITDESDTLHLSVSDGESCQPSQNLAEYDTISIGIPYHIKISFNNTLLMIQISGGEKSEYIETWPRNATLSQHLGMDVPIWWMSNKYGNNRHYNRGNGTFSNITLISSIFPTVDPTISPSNNPTISPSNNPSKFPSNDPTISPSNDPTKYPSNDPTKYPSDHPSNIATEASSDNPSATPTQTPFIETTLNPTLQPIDSTSSGSVIPTHARFIKTTITTSMDITSSPSVAPRTGPISSKSTTASFDKEDASSVIEDNSFNDRDILYIVIGFAIILCVCSIICMARKCQSTPNKASKVSMTPITNGMHTKATNIERVASLEDNDDDEGDSDDSLTNEHHHGHIKIVRHNNNDRNNDRNNQLMVHSNHGVVQQGNINSFKSNTTTIPSINDDMKQTQNEYDGAIQRNNNIMSFQSNVTSTVTTYNGMVMDHGVTTITAYNDHGIPSNTIQNTIHYESDDTDNDVIHGMDSPQGPSQNDQHRNLTLGFLHKLQEQTDTV